MGVKERKTYNLDSGVVKKFETICKKKDVKYSEQLEKILEHFIVKDEEMFVDEIFAPRIEALVENVLNKHTNRMAAMIHNSHVDSKAALIGLPIIYKKLIGVIEASIQLHMNAELLNDVETTLQSKYGSEALALKMIGDWRTNAKEMVIEESKQARPKKGVL
ncbi:hypothetical protein BIV60_15440 [Bacillus sp. MUM 116]|uniref:hypothetical protein n=1 Tax=Bacillus sp. MUM 116 TaxID=1678002 RepID=UPI0008F5660B|nr:hypothetical protein [Bacillus sp. MUM 116]OIK12916.1 hypothetical protein BIV60_15440 [Bacillus sp. MUM 116]